MVSTVLRSAVVWCSLVQSVPVSGRQRKLTAGCREIWSVTSQISGTLHQIRFHELPCFQPSIKYCTSADGCICTLGTWMFLYLQFETLYRYSASPRCFGGQVLCAMQPVMQRNILSSIILANQSFVSHSEEIVFSLLVGKVWGGLVLPIQLMLGCVDVSLR